MPDIVRGVVVDVFPRGEALDAAVEAIYSLIYGLTELAATASPATYRRALNAAKHLIRGTLFGHSGQTPSC